MEAVDWRKQSLPEITALYRERIERLVLGPISAAKK